MGGRRPARHIRSPYRRSAGLASGRSRWSDCNPRFV